MNTKIVPVMICLIGSQAAAQTGGWLIESNNAVSPSQPTTTVEVWAWFDDPSGERDAFAWADFDILAGDGKFSNSQTYLWGPGTAPGAPLGSSVTDVLVGQWWGGVGIHADTANPVLVWSGEWTTTDFTPRTVSLNTHGTTTFQIGTNSTHSGMNELELFSHGFTPGTGAITVIPSPATMAPLVALGAIALRRRRTT